MVYLFFYVQTSGGLKTRMEMKYSKLELLARDFIIRAHLAVLTRPYR